MIYGTGLLAACLLLGRLAGRCLGSSLGVTGDVGGVGIAMLLLVAATGWLQRTGRMNAPLRDGIAYWNCIYIPVVVAFVVAAVVMGLAEAVSRYATGGRLHASALVVVFGLALSYVGGVVKSIACMVLTPFVAGAIGLTNPRAAMVYGGLLGTTSGVAAGLAAVDARLVPYGAMTATFYTGLGCLVGPSLAYVVIRSLTG